MEEPLAQKNEQVEEVSRCSGECTRKYMSLVSSLLVNLMVGSYYSYSRINPYVAGYLRLYDADVTNKDTLLVLPLWLIVKGIGALLGVKLAELIGYRTTNAIAFVMFTLMNYVTSTLDDYWAFMSIYGIGSGIFIGMGYLPSIYVAWTYFPRKKPAVTGAALFMAGISASILSPLSISILNPDNIKDFQADEDILNRVPKLFRTYFLIFGALTLVGCTLQPAPAEEYNKEDKPNEADHLQQPQAGAAIPLEKKEIEFINYLERERVLQEFKTVVTEQDALLWNVMKTERMSGLIKHDKAAIEYNSDKFKKSLTIQIGSKHSKSKAGKTASTAGVSEMHIENPAATMPVFRPEEPRLKAVQAEEPQPSQQLMGATVRFDEFQRNQPEIPNYEHLVEQEVRKVEASCPSVRIALRSRHFWILVVMSYFVSIYSWLLTSVWAEYYPQKMDVSEDSKSFILSIGTFSNACSRLLSGVILLKLRFKTVFFLIATIVVISASTIDLVVSDFFTGTIYLVGAFICVGIEVVLFPTACTEVFGPLIGPQVYPYIYITFSLSNLTQYIVLVSLKQYNEMLVLLGGAAIIGAISALFLDSKPKWD